MRNNPQNILAINALQFVRAESTLVRALKMLRRTCAKRIIIAESNLRHADDSFQTLHLYRDSSTAPCRSRNGEDDTPVSLGSAGLARMSAIVSE